MGKGFQMEIFSRSRSLGWFGHAKHRVCFGDSEAYHNGSKIIAAGEFHLCQLVM